MKNIHILPTDKPSRLYYSGNNTDLLLSKEPISFRTFERSPQNIYITSDEEIKEGVNQWYLDKVLNKPRNSSGSQYGENQNVIILTTDQDLIKDGVQVIPDEFLEWFVKNHNCEYVEVKSWIKTYEDGSTFDRMDYEIIIPKEEPKPHNFCETPEEKCTMNYCDDNGCMNRKRELVEPKLERSYSEEDLKEAFYQGSSNSEGLEFGKNRFSEWLKIFKNK